MKSNLKESLDERRFIKKVDKFLNSTLFIILSTVSILILALVWYNVFVMEVFKVVAK